MRLLILGGNGMIGHKMYQVLNEDFPDTWVTLRQKLKFTKYSNFFRKEKVIDGVDLTNFPMLKTLLDEISPDVIINAAGITIRRGVNDRLSRSILTNSVLPYFLGEWVQGKEGKRLIHFSTDCVFTGNKGSYSDDSIPDAFDNYGRTKALGEVKLSQTLTLRGSMIGRELDYNTELLEWFLSQNGNVIKGFTNVVYSGITTLRMAKYVRKIIYYFPYMSGVYNVSSLTISKYDLLNLFKEVFNTKVDIIKDDSYVSRKDLISNNFFNEIQEVSPIWQDLIIELYNDSRLNNNFYNK